MRPWRVAIRTDGGAAVGLGHVRRCLNLAEALARLQAEVRFVLTDGQEMAAVVQQYGFAATTLEHGVESVRAWLRRQPTDVLVADSYAVDTGFWDVLGEAAGLRVAIDDLAQHHLPVDLVVNGLIHAPALAYSVLPQTRLLLGPAYALLHEAFGQLDARAIRDRVERILITVGGSDPHALTPRLIAWAREAMGESAALDVVVGPFFTNREAIRQAAARASGRIQLHDEPETIRELMLAADVAVTGGGQTTYELAATGTPAIAICVAQNQRETVAGLADEGTLVAVGGVDEPDLNTRVIVELRALDANAERRRTMSRRGRGLVDGLGAPRVAQAIAELLQTRAPQPRAYAAPRTR